MNVRRLCLAALPLVAGLALTAPAEAAPHPEAARVTTHQPYIVCNGVGMAGPVVTYGESYTATCQGGIGSYAILGSNPSECYSWMQGDGYGHYAFDIYCNPAPWINQGGGLNYGQVECGGLAPAGVILRGPNVGAYTPGFTATCLNGVSNYQMLGANTYRCDSWLQGDGLGHYALTYFCPWTP